MMRSMRRGALTGVLIVCWIGLSGLDLLEDLHQPCGHWATGSCAASDPASAKSAGWGALTNNIVESAHRAFESAEASFVDLSASRDAAPGFEFRGYFPRHKLFRVFLI
jgi:hypothetical protein